MFQCSIALTNRFTILWRVMQAWCQADGTNIEDFWQIVLWLNCDVHFIGSIRSGVDKLSWPADFPAMARNPSPAEKSRQVPNRSRRPLKIHVYLPSGGGETVTVLRCGTVIELKMAAQQSLGQRFLRLAAPDGHLLDPADSIRLSGFQNGDTLSAVALQPKIAATGRAFVLWIAGGDKIVTWGHPDCGGNISSGVFSRFVAPALLSLQFWQMEPWWHGAIHGMVVTAPESKIIWEMLSRFVPHTRHTMLVLQFWKMEP